MSVLRKIFVQRFQQTELENKFLLDYRIKSISYLRVSSLLGAIVLFAYGFVDYIALPESHFFAQTLRWGIMVPFFLGLCASSFRKSFVKRTEAAGVLGGLACTLIVSAIQSQTSPSEIAFDHYYVGLILINFWLATFSRLRFNLAVFTMILNDAIFLASELIFHNDYFWSSENHKYVFLLNCSFVLSTNAIGAVACFIMESYTRSEFLQKERMHSDQEKLIEKEVHLRETHEQLLKQQMVTANSSRLASLGEMAAGVAHEVNNPLAIIMGKIDTLKRQLPNDTPASLALRKDLDRILNASSRIAKIVGGLRTFSRDGSNDDFQPESLRQIVSETLALCKERFLQNGIDLVTAEVPDIRAYCRATQISQVLLNLLNNAFDAVMECSVRKIEISFTVDLEVITIHVKDSGSGIKPEIQQKIMQPFFTTKPVGKGTGLGLSISKSIIEQHGGALLLKSNEQGSTFSFSLRRYIQKASLTG